MKKDRISRGPAHQPYSDSVSLRLHLQRLIAVEGVAVGKPSLNREKAGPREIRSFFMTRLGVESPELRLGKDQRKLFCLQLQNGREFNNVQTDATDVSLDSNNDTKPKSDKTPEDGENFLTE
jgi:hypothetical protein